MNAQLQSEYSRRGCELCGEISARELYTAKDRLRNSDQEFVIVECRGCGVLRTLPDMTESELAPFYPNDYWGGREPSQEWIEASQSDKTDFLKKCNLTQGHILDVGCGSGFFLRALEREKWDCFGIEINPQAANAASRALGDGRVFAGTFIESECGDAFFDVVTMWSALEHTNEPKANLREARRVLKDGGTLILQVPNAASYQARLFRGDWFALDAPRHRYHFSWEVLKPHLAEAGFETYRLTYFSKAHNAHALRQSLKSRFTHKKGLAGRALFLLSTPFIKPLDLWMSALGRGATLTIAARAR